MPHDFIEPSTFCRLQHQLRCVLPGHPCRFELIEIENVASAVGEQAERLAAFDHYWPRKLSPPVFRSAL